MKATQKRIETPDLFHGLKPEELERILSCSHAQHVQAGTILFHEGEPANRFYILNTGKIEIEAHEPGGATVFVEHIQPGEVFGWSWLFPPFTWHFRARVVADSELTVLDGACLLRMAEENHGFGFALMKRVAHVLIQRLNATRQRLLEKSRPAAAA